MRVSGTQGSRVCSQGAYRFGLGVELGFRVVGFSGFGQEDLEGLGQWGLGR